MAMEFLVGHDSSQFIAVVIDFPYLVGVPIG